ncbi:MAG TPA: PD-(D/E)XK nuclease family protein [Acidimicrobiales bacterium]|nr:PD-(D/E)XK nuclease family protein [Acidimicrobiales bacterium]
MSFAPPETLSPSKLDRFTHCALAFRLSYIDRLPEPSTLQQVRGTLVHRALQLLHAVEPAQQRTPERARLCLEEAWSELSVDGQVRGLQLDTESAADLLRRAALLLDRYFTLEDPRQVRAIGLELMLDAAMDGVAVHGIIDRLDVLRSGELVIVDYKTGRSPSAERARSRLAGVLVYAFLCEQRLGRRPVELRLMYLRDQVVLVERPSEQAMRGLRQRALAVWAAIERACAEEDFRPSPSPLCRYCAFQSCCPAFGGSLPLGMPMSNVA